ncbi:hypothetical protein COEREDRAFT_79688 [Coemansia reversa NRRL 1564]|uniref:Uncharacterized protein n=1 Tax=Coemansia reversa (strain ATCC 12441 / NRRL 1564) TaxID=763665 RepID=A0A2G5BI36_COERN|nr:hypothetical protein COEREDRAFT_79688 [Coemansia reversa NRRL 1564]|eukprot:PIA18686.1 hypothetical protein COEREDRAFT_79688 [Coemansia reversa NRRL 1564]
MLSDTPIAIRLPFEPYSSKHNMAIRYMSRLLVDDVAGEMIPKDALPNSVVCVSDLPVPTLVIRPGMKWLCGLSLPNSALVVAVNKDDIITFVGCPETGPSVHMSQKKQQLMPGGQVSN